jgi:broad specificity phosphatase PhoE
VGAVHTTIFLIRAAETEWGAAGRLLGRHDVTLSQAGRAQADEAARALASVPVSEVLCSPLLRAVETAQRIAAPHRLEVSRDARLSDLQAGRWEGRRFDELDGDDAWRGLLGGGPSEGGAESLVELRERAVASIEQVVDDNQLGANLVVVSHGLVVRALLAHYLGLPLAEQRRLRVRPAAIAVLRVDGEAPPALLAVDAAAPLTEILRDA